MTISPGSVREDAGTSGAFITLTKRGFPLNEQLDLDLFFDDPTEVIIPLLAGGSAISIPANQQQIVIPVNVLDDTLRTVRRLNVLMHSPQTMQMGQSKRTPSQIRQDPQPV